MNDLNDIKNSTSRVWTTDQLRETVAQARRAKLSVVKASGFTTITDPVTGLVVLRSLPMRPGVNMVRFDQSFFDGSRKLAYVYIDKNGLVCYCCDVDSRQNRENSGWKRFEVPEKNLRSFFRYYELRYHPLTKAARV